MYLQVLLSTVVMGSSPQSECLQAIQYLERLSPDDRCFTRFVSYYTVPEEIREQFIEGQAYWFRNLTLSPNRRVKPKQVSDTLYALDLRDFRWNPAAWRAIAKLEPRFREPSVDHLIACRLRDLVGETKNERFHIIAIVDGFWMFRETYETVRTPTYYDLLFAEQRHGGKEFKDFPKTLDEWLGAFLADKTIAELDKNQDRIRIRKGAVIDGMNDAKKGSSYVAYNNREVWGTPVPTGLFAITFDQKKSSGKEDLQENHFTDEKEDQKRIIFAGGEAIITLPAGDAQAFLLIDGKKNRVEQAPPDLVRNTRGSRETHINNGPGQCMLCHLEFNGWITCNNTIERDFAKGIETKFKDRERAINYEAFFTDIEDLFETHRVGIKKGVSANSSIPATKLGAKYQEWKDRFDDELGIEDICREHSIEKKQLLEMISKSPLKRFAQLKKGIGIPRRVWDDELYFESAKLLWVRGYQK